ncbi:MAG: ChbG/HpnK family deacetylase [Alphaproteobacteria bacterium]|nr:ChbG/HpnK family deacetylase [Alphaproteobacteria bacterium]
MPKKSERRIAILHADDVGMCHGANRAFLDLAKIGAITCGSAMVPCPWFAEIAEHAGRDPRLDLGVHLTLTSEWPGYRWGPISTRARASGLVDDQGCFPRNCRQLRATLVPEAVEAEWRAQIDRALAMGIDATHLDSHMGSAFLPELVEIYLRLGREYRLPVLMPRRLDEYLRVLKFDFVSAASHRRAVAELEAEGMPLVDDFRMTPGAASAESDAAYAKLFAELPAGTTYVALHPNRSGDIETIVPPRAHYRTDEVRILSDDGFLRGLDALGIERAGMRALRERYRARPR